MISDTYDSDDSQGDPVFVMPQAATSDANQENAARIVSMSAIPEEDDSMMLKETLESSANRGSI